jgi:hypothetical protein
VGQHATLIESKIRMLGHLNVHIFASTSVPCRLATVQMPNLALIETKLITVLELVYLPDMLKGTVT